MPAYYCSIVLLVLSFACAEAAISATYNGFDLSNSLVPKEEIYHGGPRKDGIPAIDNPLFIKASEAGFLKNSDRVLGIIRNNSVKAYPIRILNWHEIVNNSYERENVLVTYCPLCGTGMAFLIDGNLKELDFGVSGLLHNSDLLFYDRKTNSLWSQILGKAISGELVGQRLKQLPLSHTTWKDWKEKYPETMVLSRKTGYLRDYSRDPYEGYSNSKSIYFPVLNNSRRYHPKEQVIGIEINGEYKAYPFSELSKTKLNITDDLAGKKVTVIFDRENQTGKVLDNTGNELPSLISYWFAWFAFHPDTQIYLPLQ